MARQGRLGARAPVAWVERLDHLVLTVADIAATTRFYERALGLTPEQVRDPDGNLIEFLAARGAKLDVVNAKGWTPLTVADGVEYTPAVLKRYPEAAALLRKLMREQGLAVPASDANFNRPSIRSSVCASGNGRN